MFFFSSNLGICALKSHKWSWRPVTVQVFVCRAIYITAVKLPHNLKTILGEVRHNPDPHLNNNTITQAPLEGNQCKKYPQLTDSFFGHELFTFHPSSQKYRSQEFSQKTPTVISGFNILLYFIVLIFKCIFLFQSYFSFIAYLKLSFVVCIIFFFAGIHWGQQRYPM